MITLIIKTLVVAILLAIAISVTIHIIIDVIAAFSNGYQEVKVHPSIWLVPCFWFCAAYIVDKLWIVKTIQENIDNIALLV